MSSEHNSRRLSQTYHRMLEQIRHSIESTEENLSSSLDHAFEAARKNISDLGQLTRDEAQLLSEYIRRDTHDIAHRMSESRKEARSWLHMDVELVEASLLDNLMAVADQTQVALAKLNAAAHEYSEYQTGEVCGPGVLICEQCGARLEFTQPEQIPQCKECGNSGFRRPEIN